MSLLRKFSSRDLLLIAVFSALGLAVKPIVTPLIHLISAPLMIPGGSLAGGFYMMWIALAIAVTRKFGTGILIGITQAIVMISLGYFGNHGAVSLLSYTLPGLAAELTALPFKDFNKPDPHILICMTANVTGTVVVIFLVMRLPLVPALISVSVSTLSGILGGIISLALYKKLLKFNLI